MPPNRRIIAKTKIRREDIFISVGLSSVVAVVHVDFNELSSDAKSNAVGVVRGFVPLKENSFYSFGVFCESCGRGKEVAVGDTPLVYVSVVVVTFWYAVEWVTVWECVHVVQFVEVFIITENFFRKIVFLRENFFKEIFLNVFFWEIFLKKERKIFFYNPLNKFSSLSSRSNPVS